jgi:hypothetical protein
MSDLFLHPAARSAHPVGDLQGGLAQRRQLRPVRHQAGDLLAVAGAPSGDVLALPGEEPMPVATFCERSEGWQRLRPP